LIKSALQNEEGVEYLIDCQNQPLLENAAKNNNWETDEADKLEMSNDASSMRQNEKLGDVPMHEEKNN
jgi:hypothetical protein